MALDSDEYLSWGYWSQELSDGTAVAKHILPSLWIGGSSVELADTQSYISSMIGNTVSDVVYSGELMGNYINNGGS